MRLYLYTSKNETEAKLTFPFLSLCTDTLSEVPACIAAAELLQFTV